MAVGHENLLFHTKSYTKIVLMMPKDFTNLYTVKRVNYPAKSMKNQVLLSNININIIYGNTIEQRNGNYFLLGGSHGERDPQC